MRSAHRVCFDACSGARGYGRLCAKLFACLAMLVLSTPATRAQGTNAGGVQVQARFTPLSEGGLAELELQLRDGATQQALDLPPRRLAAWLQKPLPGLAAAEISCPDKVRMLASPGLGRRATADLNTHRLMALNSDNSITFINPFLRLNRAKLEEVLTLPGTPGAVLHRPQRHEVWLALPEQDQVLVVDTDLRRIVHAHTLAAGARPVALAESAGAVWVAQAGRDEWLRFDAAAVPPQALAAPRVQGWLVSAAGAPPLGLGVDGVVNADGRVEPTGRVLLAAWSELGQRTLAAPAAGGLLWLDAQGQVQRRLDSAPVQRLALFDNGRYALAALAERAMVLDVADGRVLQEVPLTSSVSELAFSPGFAYLHSPGAARATLLSLADLRRGAARPVQLAVGAQPHAEPPSLSPASGARRLQPLPDGSGMYVASPHDGEIYQYAEGMMAPIGSFSNYRRGALALLVLDDGLQALGKGRYRAVLRAPKGGSYELVLSGIQPRFADCRNLEVPQMARDEAAAREPTAAGLQALLLDASPVPGGMRLRAQLRDRVGGGPVGQVPDLVLLAFDRKSGWQSRHHMRAVAPEADGIYEAEIERGDLAALDLRVSSASRDLPFHLGGLQTVSAPSRRAAP